MEDRTCTPASTAQESPSEVRRTLAAELRARLRVLGKQYCDRRIGNFHFKEILGVGGMGCVFAASDLNIDRLVAVKLLLEPGLDLPTNWRRRFQAEVRAVAMLEHPAIVRAYHAGEIEGIPYLAMELVRGTTLREIIKYYCTADAAEPAPSAATIARRLWNARGEASDEGAADEETAESRSGGNTSSTSQRFQDAVSIGIDIADALACAHSNRILHRDVKPSNILIDLDGRAKLSDFGLARIDRESQQVTQSGMLLGTLRYMSPEHVSGGKNTARGDIFSLGATLYELITLRPLCPANEPHEVIQFLSRGRFVPPRDLVPDLPRELEAILLKATARDPAQRYASARELADDLRRFRDGMPVQARHPTWWQSMREWAYQHPRAAIVLAAVMMVLLLLVSGLQWHNRRLAKLNADLDRAVKRAEAASQQAEQARVRSEHLLYASEIARAHEAIDRGNVAEAAALLSRYRPSATQYPVDFEWRFLARQIGLLADSISISQKPLYAVAVSPDGECIAMAGQDATIYLRYADLLSQRREIATGQIEVNRLAFSRDGSRLLSAGDDGTVRIWDVATGKELLSVNCGAQRVLNAQFALDDEVFLSAS
ncbi:MAG: hypothetical protein D6753_09595, partial [Planctomycetota bacterium]